MTPPYYIIPLIEEYRSLDPDSDRAILLKKRITVNIGDPEALKKIFNTPQQEKETPSITDKEKPSDTIESFLDKVGAKVVPTGYMSQIAEEYVLPEEEEEIEEKTVQKKTVEEDQQDTLSSLIRKHKYVEALRFIQEQNLNNTQKSIYFAHQMRFLRKLILLEQHRNKTKG